MQNILTQEKAKRTLIEHYGVDNPMKNEYVKEIYKNILIKKYGVDNAMKCPDISKKMAETVINKHKTTNSSYQIYGFLRETNDIAIKECVDKKTGIARTGLDEYLKIIFPEIDDTEWLHDKTIPNIKTKIRPDYRCEKLKIVIEFDGLPHFANPDVILSDIKKDKMYFDAGYKVIRIPYFIQLTNEAVEIMFGRKVDTALFDPNIPSFNIEHRCTPAFCCSLGIKQMAKYFHIYKQQYDVNIEYLKSINNENLSGLKLLVDEFEK